LVVKRFGRTHHILHVAAEILHVPSQLLLEAIGQGIKLL
jgi:hypothetical protein